MLLQTYSHKKGFENSRMRQYYIYDGETERGPFNIEQLKLQALNKETPVWYEGLENWSAAKNVDELQEVLIYKITPPPLPKVFEKKSVTRDEVLNSFSDALEIVPEYPKKSLVKPVLIFVVIAGILLFFCVSRLI